MMRRFTCENKKVAEQNSSGTVQWPVARARSRLLGLSSGSAKLKWLQLGLGHVSTLSLVGPCQWRKYPPPPTTSVAPTRRRRTLQCKIAIVVVKNTQIYEILRFECSFYSRCKRWKCYNIFKQLDIIQTWSTTVNSVCIMYSKRNEITTCTYNSA